MKKSVFFRLTDEEFTNLESYCEETGRSKSDVLRELIRSLKTKRKPSF
ncbi:MAG: ribbon-helix-helix protein, CopG family [Spirirestis rafaelensis WJT71-NPBG6]|nr:ribbon-helix-helix protein, CopG family [Spirirestis rafaelensis WJT71-NPBG6]